MFLLHLFWGEKAITICSLFSNVKIKYKHQQLNFSRKKMLIHFVMTLCSDSFPSTFEMPQLILPNFVFLQLTVNKAKPFCMPACLNPSCCIIYRSLFAAGEFGKRNCRLQHFKEIGGKKDKFRAKMHSENKRLLSQQFERAAPCLTWSLSILDTSHYY